MRAQAGRRQSQRTGDTAQTPTSEGPSWQTSGHLARERGGEGSGPQARPLGVGCQRHRGWQPTPRGLCGFL